MIYAAVLDKTDNAITVGAYNNKPLVDIVAFDNKADFDAMQDHFWMGDRYTGDNLVRVSRKDVQGWFGRDFAFRSWHRGVLGGISVMEVCRDYEA